MAGLFETPETIEELGALLGWQAQDGFAQKGQRRHADVRTTFPQFARQNLADPVQQFLIGNALSRLRGILQRLDPAFGNHPPPVLRDGGSIGCESTHGGSGWRGTGTQRVV